MSSDDQIAANRRNGERSHGPQSDEGKAASSKNSLKHGLTAKEVLLPNEDAEAFAELGEGLRTELNPQGALESVLVERIISLNWRLRRLGKIEAEIFDSQRDSMRDGVANWRALQLRSDPRYFQRAAKSARIWGTNKKVRKVLEQMEVQEAKLERLLGEPYLEAVLDKEKEMQEYELPPPTYGEAFLVDSSNQNALAKLSRYATSMERSLFKALHELQRLQAARQGKDVPVPLALDVDVSGVERQ